MDEPGLCSPQSTVTRNSEASHRFSIGSSGSSNGKMKSVLQSAFRRSIDALRPSKGGRGSWDRDSALLPSHPSGNAHKAE